MPTRSSASDSPPSSAISPRSRPLAAESGLASTPSTSSFDNGPAALWLIEPCSKWKHAPVFNDRELCGSPLSPSELGLLSQLGSDLTFSFEERT